MTHTKNAPACTPAPFSGMSPEAKREMDRLSLLTAGEANGERCSSSDDDRTVQFEGMTLYVRVSFPRQSNYKIDLYTLNGQPYATAGIMMALPPEERLGPHEILIKDSGVNAGILQALTDANIVWPTGRTVRWYSQRYAVCRLLPER